MAAVTVAVLCAAVLHATWNAIAHAVTDRLVGFSLLGLTALICALATVPFVALPGAGAWPFLLASGAVHVGYNLFLMQSYRLGEFNQVYPLARGTSPWVVALFATVFVGESMPPAHLAGVAVVSAGLATLVLAGGLPGRHEVPALIAAFCTGLLIAGYTLLDGLGVRRSGSTLGYIGWLFVLDGLPMVLLALAVRRRALVQQARPYLAVGAAAGVLSVVAYGLVLWAQTRGALASVAALREASIIVGAIIGAVFFHERFGRIRTVSTVVVVCGIVLLNV